MPKLVTLGWTLLPLVAVGLNYGALLSLKAGDNKHLAFFLLAPLFLGRLWRRFGPTDGLLLSLFQRAPALAAGGILVGTAWGSALTVAAFIAAALAHARWLAATVDRDEPPIREAVVAASFGGGSATVAAFDLAIRSSASAVSPAILVAFASMASMISAGDSDIAAWQQVRRIANPPASVARGISHRVRFGAGPGLGRFFLLEALGAAWQTSRLCWVVAALHHPSYATLYLGLFLVGTGIFPPLGLQARLISFPQFASRLSLRWSVVRHFSLVKDTLTVSFVGAYESMALLLLLVVGSLQAPNLWPFLLTPLPFLLDSFGRISSHPICRSAREIGVLTAVLLISVAPVAHPASPGTDVMGACCLFVPYVLSIAALPKWLVSATKWLHQRWYEALIENPT